MWISLLACLAVTAGPQSIAHPDRYFTIQVLDEETGRGVPLVFLTTVDQREFVTDSQGIVAFDDADLLGQEVFFHVKSHGYEFPKNGFGFRGKILKTTPGESATLQIHRHNIAERLYRVTGGGIYRDSLAVGKESPIKHPLLNAQVVGQDSVVNAVYRNQIYWFWGDTSQARFPLGNFHVPCATSSLPDQGGLDPKRGVDLDYFVEDTGFVKSTCKMAGEGPTWIGGLTVLQEPGSSAGDPPRERMLAGYVKVKPPLNPYAWGIVEFNDKAAAFAEVARFESKPDAYPMGHSFHHKHGDADWVYYANPLPLLRVSASRAAVIDPSQYESYTCLDESHQVVRDDEGLAQYDWRKGVPPMSFKLERELIADGKIDASQAMIQVQDADTGKSIALAAGSTYYNSFRGRFVTIAVEVYGKESMLGEVWYLEADALTGPFVYARKIVTHEKYSFYNPKQHPMFDQEGGRILFFEGTYSQTFSGNEHATPMYDYNQMMYSLRLDSPRLALPVPVYGLNDSPRRPLLMGGTHSREVFPGTESSKTPKEHDHEPKKIKSSTDVVPALWPIQFFAPDLPGEGTVPVTLQDAGGPRPRLVVSESSGEKQSIAAFHAIPCSRESPPATTVPLFEFVNTVDETFAYSTDPNAFGNDYVRREQPVCQVWKSPYPMNRRWKIHWVE